MKRKTTISLMLCVAMAVAFLPGRAAASSDFPNYFTMGENDTVRLAASVWGNEVTLPVHANFSQLVRQWELTLTYPAGITPINAESTSAMDVHYLDSLGQDQVYHVTLFHAEELTYFSASIWAQCYWDPYGYGIYFPYGTATWTRGYYDEMFRLTLSVDKSFKEGVLTIKGNFTIKSEDGSSTSTGVCYTPLTIIVDYVPGDVNGDGLVNITDATLLINYLLNDSQDELTPAADVNGDGLFNITDATELINRLLTE